LIGQREKTIVYGPKSSHVFSVFASNVAIINMTIHNSGYEMAGIYVEDSINITLISNIIESNYYGILLKNVSFSSISNNFFKATT